MRNRSPAGLANLLVPPLPVHSREQAGSGRPGQGCSKKCPSLSFHAPLTPNPTPPSTGVRGEKSAAACLALPLPKLNHVPNADDHAGAVGAERAWPKGPGVVEDTKRRARVGIPDTDGM